MNFTDNILLYQAPDGQTQLDVQLDQETVWLSQAQIAELFGRDQGVISRHLKNIFATGELISPNAEKMLMVFQWQFEKRD